MDIGTESRAPSVKNQWDSIPYGETNYLVFKYPYKVVYTRPLAGDDYNEFFLNWNCPVPARIDKLTDYLTYLEAATGSGVNEGTDTIRRLPASLAESHNLNFQTFASAGPYGPMDYTGPVWTTQGDDHVEIILPDGSTKKVSRVSIKSSVDFRDTVGKEVDLYCDLKGGEDEVELGSGTSKQTIPLQTILKVRAKILQDEADIETDCRPPKTDWRFELLPRDSSETECTVDISVLDELSVGCGSTYCFAKAGGLIREKSVGNMCGGGVAICQLEHLIPLRKLPQQDTVQIQIGGSRSNPDSADGVTSRLAGVQI